MISIELHVMIMPKALLIDGLNKFKRNDWVSFHMQIGENHIFSFTLILLNLKSTRLFYSHANMFCIFLNISPIHMTIKFEMFVIFFLKQIRYT